MEACVAVSDIVKLKYEKPVMVKAEKMVFPIEIIEANGKRMVCRQCSSCHGCR